MIERILIGVVAFGLGVLVRDVAQDWRDQAALKVGKQISTYREARIWSKKCEKLGKSPLITDADGKKPVITCVSAKELRA